MNYQIDVTATAPVYPTERRERVATAITNVFPEAELTHEDDRIVATSHSLEALSDALHDREILDTARGTFFDGRDGNRFSFRLKKQAALGEIVTFAVGEPAELGDIDVEVVVHSPSVESFVDHVAPPTQDGEPITQDGGG